MASLVDMPELVMDKILDKLEFRSILSLQKVSRGFYEFIDSRKPDFKLQEIEVDVTPARVQLVLNSSKKTKSVKIEYQNYVFGCLIACDKKRKAIEHEDFLEVFAKDLDQILSHQKSNLMQFRFKGLRIPVDLKDVLKKRSIKTIRLFMEIEQSEQFLETLPYFDAKSLKDVYVYNYNSTKETLLDVGTIVNLGHWNNLRTFMTRGFQVNLPIHNFAHLQEANISVKAVSAEDLLFLKNAIIRNPNFDRFELKFKTLTNENYIPSLFGPTLFNSFLRLDQSGFFKFPDLDGDVLSVLYCSYYIQFSCLHAKNDLERMNL